MPHHVVVDGSNIATEGRSQPSLKQLNEAVMAFIQERPDALITVVVDATFGHRIDPKESNEFDEAVANNELVAPPAGAIGRGDAFVLSIANKVNAVILTNDSYQEFHGQYDWLFEEGRLIGGKPVPHIGWVFVPRLPVRGPLSRKVTAEAKRRGGRGRNADAPAADAGTVRVGSPEASKPMPVPKTPPPRAAAAAAPVVAPAAAAEAPAAPTGKRGDLNEVMPFLTFVERHPAGTSVNAIVDHYSSHGAYVKVGDIMGYVPLRLMADPAPRSAREFVKLGEAITLVVEKFVPEKRSVDLAVPGMGSAPMVEAKPAKAARARKATKKAADVEPAVPVVEPVIEAAPAKPRRGTKKAAPAAAVVVEAAPAAPVEEAPKRPTRRTAKKASAPVEAAPAPVVEPVPATDVAVKKASAKKAAAKKAPAKKAVAAKAASPKKAVAKKSAG
ncbi:MAG: hypothetical protein RJA49_1737 [Actinomycetota bacterium]